MTSATSVPQRSKAPPNKRIQGLGSLVSANDIHLRRTRAQLSKIRPQGRSLGKHLEPWCPGLGNFPGALSWSRCPLSPVECPRHSLTTAGHLHPEISGPVPPRGSDTWGGGASIRAYVEANPQTPPSSHHHPEDPLVLPSVKGSPFTHGRTGGRPPGDGFCPSRGWPVSGPDPEPRMRTQDTPPQASLGATYPTLE